MSNIKRSAEQTVTDIKAGKTLTLDVSAEDLDIEPGKPGDIVGMLNAVTDIVNKLKTDTLNDNIPVELSITELSVTIAGLYNMMHVWLGMGESPIKEVKIMIVNKEDKLNKSIQVHLEANKNTPLNTPLNTLPSSANEALSVHRINHNSSFDSSAHLPVANKRRVN